MRNTTHSLNVPARFSLQLAPALVLAALMVLCPVNARADSIALTFSGGTPSVFFSNLTNGWAFSTASAITVTSLGYWDFGSDGLATSHQVGIWNSAGTLLMSGTVAAGTAESLSNGFRFNSTISGAPLLAAGTYVIGGLTSSDPVARQVPLGNLSLAPGISFIQERFNGGGQALTFPSFTDRFATDSGFFGPDFQFNAVSASVPESGGTFLLMLGAVAGLFVLRRLFAAELSPPARI
jgi:hypothetical protein